MGNTHIAHRVLWIDDDPTFLETSSQLLRSEGIEVDRARCGREGLQLARERDYAGLILDIRLPDSSGLDVLEALARIGRRPRTLVLSGFPAVENVVRAMKAGAVDFRAKPLFGDDLILAVHQLCSTEHVSVEAARNCVTGSDESSSHLMGELNRIAADHAVTVDIRRQLTRDCLVRSLSDPGTDRVLLAICCDSVRRLKRPDLRVEVLEEINTRLREAPRLQDCSVTVRAALRDLEASPMTAGLPTRHHAFAEPPELALREISRMLRRQTGFGLRYWKGLLRLVPAFVELKETSEQIAQIAYRIEYEHPTQLDRDFRRIVGLSPTEFRRIVRQV